MSKSLWEKIKKYFSAPARNERNIRTNQLRRDESVHDMKGRADISEPSAMDPGLTRGINTVENMPEESQLT